MLKYKRDIFVHDYSINYVKHEENEYVKMVHLVGLLVLCGFLYGIGIVISLYERKKSGKVALYKFLDLIVNCTKS